MFQNKLTVVNLLNKAIFVYLGGSRKGITLKNLSLLEKCACKFGIQGERV